MKGNIWQKIIKWSIYLLVFLMPLFWLPVTYEVYNFNKVYLLSGLTAVGLLAWVGKMIFKDKEIRFKRTPLDFFVLGFLIIMGINAIVSNDRVSSILGSYGRFWPSLLGILSLGAFYFLITNNVTLKIEEKKKEEISSDHLISAFALIKAFLYSCGIAVFVGILSIFGTWINLTNAGAKIPYAMRTLAFNTVGGTLEVLGVFLSVIIVFLVGIIQFKNGFISEKKSKFFGVYCYILLFASLLTLILLNIWITWVIIAVSLILLLVFSFWKRIFKEDVNKLGLSIFLIIISLTFVFVNPLKFILPEGNVLFNLPYEIMLRNGASWNLGFQGMKESFILGPGLGNFGYVFSKFKPGNLLQTDFWKLRFDKAGNHMAEVLGTTGILGLLSYLALIGMALFSSFVFILGKLEKKKDKINELVIMPFVIALIAIIISQFFYYQNVLLAFIFWLFIGLLSLNWQREENEKVFNFKEFPEVGLILNVSFWLLIVGFSVSSFSLGKYYLADMKYRQYILNPTENLGKLEEAVRFAPKRSSYYITLAGAYWDRLLQELSKEEPDNQAVANFVALSLNSAKKAQLLSPNNVATQEAMAVIYRDSRNLVEGSLDWSIKTFEEALKLEPENPIFLTQLGKLKLLQEKNEEAKELLQKAADLRSAYEDPQIQLAIIYEKEGNIDEAIRKLEGTVSQNPFMVEAKFQLGRLYYNKKEVKKAREQFESAVIAYPDHSNSLYSLGIIYEQEGEKENAIKLFERVLELNPNNEAVKAKLQSAKRVTPVIKEEEE